MSSRQHTAALILLLGICASTAGCTSSGSLHDSQQAESVQDYDRAVVEYTKALRLKPDDQEARLSLERARLRASSEHYQRGRRLGATGKFDQALVEFELAAELNPTSSEVDAELKATRRQLRARVAVHNGKTDLQTLIERARDLPPPGLDLPAVSMPESLIFRDAGSRDVFLAIARFANISLAFDATFRDAPVTVDLRNASLGDALRTVSDAARSFYRVTGPR